MIKITTFFIAIVFSLSALCGVECKKAEAFLKKWQDTIDVILAHKFENPDLADIIDGFRERIHDLKYEVKLNLDYYELQCQRNLKIVSDVTSFLGNAYNEEKKKLAATPTTPSSPTTPSAPTGPETPAQTPASTPTGPSTPAQTPASTPTGPETPTQTPLQPVPPA